MEVNVDGRAVSTQSAVSLGLLQNDVLLQPSSPCRFVINVRCTQSLPTGFCLDPSAVRVLSSAVVMMSQQQGNGGSPLPHRHKQSVPCRINHHHAQLVLLWISKSQPVSLVHAELNNPTLIYTQNNQSYTTLNYTHSDWCCTAKLYQRPL